MKIDAYYFNAFLFEYKKGKYSKIWIHWKIHNMQR